MTFSRLLLKPLKKYGFQIFSKVRKTEKPQGLQKIQGRYKKPKSWEKTQVAATLFTIRASIIV